MGRVTIRFGHKGGEKKWSKSGLSQEVWSVAAWSSESQEIFLRVHQTPDAIKHLKTVKPIIP